jgi:glutamate racemase
MHRAAIGVFDSGIGGLTVAAEIVRQLPSEDLVYLGDTARIPYGTRSPKTVTRYAQRALDLLLRYPIKVVVVACNTATACALPALAASTELPILGVVEPGARAAVAVSHSGKIGIAGTEGTLRSGAYQRAIRALKPDAQLSDTPWPLLVPMAEEGWIDHPVTRLTLETYLRPFVDSEVDTLVLGCTHYPVFKGVIQEVLHEKFGGYTLNLVDSAEAVTIELATLLHGEQLQAPERAGRRSFFCTDAEARFLRVGHAFFPGDLSSLRTVDL